MKKILFWGDSPACSTGLGVVSKNILAGLKDYEIVVIGINDRGGWKDPQEYPYKIYNPIYYSSDDIYGKVRLLRVLLGTDKEIKFNPDIIIANTDFFLFSSLINEVPMWQLIKEAIRKKDIKTIIYTPIDNEFIYSEWIDIFNLFDKIIVPTNFAKMVLGNYIAEPIEVVYYPIDTKNFYPQKIKRVENRFVIGYVGRNQWRKDLFSLIYIFSLFKKKYPDAFLYIHSQPKDKIQQGWDLFRIAENFGLKDKKDYYFPDIDDNQGIQRESLIDVYNRMNVFFSTSTGEGFGLPYAEASLCEIPVIIPDNSVAYDFKDYLIVYKSSRLHSFGWIDGNRIRPLADVVDALKKLEWVYQNYQKAKEITKRARKFFSNFSLEKQAEKFRQVIVSP